MKLQKTRAMKLVELGDNLSYVKGKKPSALSLIQENDYLPYVDLELLTKGIVKSWTDGKDCLSCQKGDVLILFWGARSGFVGQAIDGFVGSTLAKISHPEVTNTYLYYFLKSKFLDLNHSSRGTAQPNLDQKFLRSLQIPLPSFDDQQKIVAPLVLLDAEGGDSEMRALGKKIKVSYL
ncbi:type I restriction modification system HsdS component [Candidatus Mycoplasma haematolamae str. Purdue]|uniref:Type I restriction modification system HsdS component n=1 Tax=Mycoplasma haematolamae (strain Purdue) TaxID=1212765 RepID=I7C6E0_MYCHA|nr:restriction endonuclease subunit S [Candidatus Mycoplasma haematolamae]AFO52067.1 type I restriction modification system HsdS component [Candidatus Mycoplasma haematolamae str. Purdue]